MRKEILKQLKTKAIHVSKDREVMKEIIENASQKARAHESKLKDGWAGLQTLLRMLKAWGSGRYREMPWKSLIASIAAILYFINPFDLIPDFLLLGLADDAMLIGWVISSIKADLNRFLVWEKNHSD